MTNIKNICVDPSIYYNEELGLCAENSQEEASAVSLSSRENTNRKNFTLFRAAVVGVPNESGTDYEVRKDMWVWQVDCFRRFQR